MNPRDRLRSVGRRVSDPAEALAQQVTERVVDLLLNALDINEVATQVDLNALIARVDIDKTVLDRVDINRAVLERVDVNTLLDRVDVNALLDRVDVNALLDRVDLKPLLDRVDADDLVSRVDVNALVGKIDMDALVASTDLGAAIARSSGGMGAEALDAVRSQAVGLDQFIDRWIQRLLRPKHPFPPAPVALLPAQAKP